MALHGEVAPSDGGAGAWDRHDTPWDGPAYLVVEITALDPSAITGIEVDGPAVRLVRVQGEVDLATAPQLREALRDALRPPTTLLVIDLSEVSLLSATGLGALVETARDGRARGVETAVVLGRAARLTMAVVGGPTVLRCHYSLAEVLGGPG